MALAKRFLKGRPACKVRFSISAAESGDAESVHLVGDFNDWDLDATPMRKQKNGDFSAELELTPGATYKFRYRAQDGRWLNDSGADGYEFCEFARADNSILKL